MGCGAWIDKGEILYMRIETEDFKSSQSLVRPVGLDEAARMRVVDWSV
jgi:hypothetical protein